MKDYLRKLRLILPQSCLKEYNCYTQTFPYNYNYLFLWFETVRLYFFFVYIKYYEFQ